MRYFLMLGLFVILMLTFAPVLVHTYIDRIKSYKNTRTFVE